MELATSIMRCSYRYLPLVIVVAAVLGLLAVTLGVLPRPPRH